MDNIIEKKSLEYIAEIKEMTKNKTFKELEQELNSHNNDDELFDFNYGSITGTIFKNGNMGNLQDSFEVWDDEKCLMVFQNVSEIELKRLCN